MKMTSMDKAVLFLGAGLLILSYISVKRGQGTLGICWLIGASGCGVMLYASHGGRKNHNKNK